MYSMLLVVKYDISSRQYPLSSNGNGNMALIEGILDHVINDLPAANEILRLNDISNGMLSIASALHISNWAGGSQLQMVGRLICHRGSESLSNRLLMQMYGLCRPRSSSMKTTTTTRHL